MKNILVLISSVLILAVPVLAQTKKAAPVHKTVTPAYHQPTSSYSSGSSFQNEFDLNFSQGTIGTTYNGSKNVTNISIFGVYSYDLGNQFQVGTDVGLNVNDSTTRFTLFGTGTYNLDRDYSNSIFAKLGLGLYPVSKFNENTLKVEDKSEFAFYIAGGKRFPLWDHVNYKPALVIEKVSGIDTFFILQFLNVSFNW